MVLASLPMTLTLRTHTKEEPIETYDFPPLTKFYYQKLPRDPSMKG